MMRGYKDEKRKRVHRLFCFMVFAYIVMMLTATRADAASSPSLNRKQATILVKKTVSLKVKNTKKSVQWSSDQKEVATVKDGKVTGNKKGTAIITAKVGNKKLTCKVRVVEKYSMNTAYNYLERYLKKHYKKWKYVTFKSEAMESNGKYMFPIRYQGGNSANTLVGTVSVNPKTGKAEFESLYDSKKTVWKIF